MRWTTSCCFACDAARCASTAAQAESPSASPIAISARIFDERIFPPCRSLVGGFDELKAPDDQGKLDGLLAEAAAA
jgi:hypothetical protein